jgi:hypothetical protein
VSVKKICKRFGLNSLLGQKQVVEQVEIGVEFLALVQRAPNPIRLRSHQNNVIAVSHMLVVYPPEVLELVPVGGSREGVGELECARARRGG